MISLNVVNVRGESVGTVEIDPAEFGGEINRQLLHDVVVMHLANQRAGTHSTLRRGEVAGSTKKLFRQKGTGNARVGTRRTNKRRGGGTAKGPKPRDYEYHLPKKAVRKATRMARKRLETANGLLKTGNHAGFYDETHKAIWGYLSDKLRIPVALLTRDTTVEALKKGGVTETTMTTLISILDYCEYARFARMENSKKPEHVYHEAVSVITKIEDELRG